MASDSDSGPMADTENMPPGGESFPNKVSRLRETYPNHISLIEVATRLGISRAAVTQYHSHRIGFILVEGVRLFPRSVVEAYAKSRRRSSAIGRIAVKGIEVERLQRICESYYRQNLDIAPSELLALAKRIAKL